jgi:ABC-type nitrate/sulfonate/bicarbonate transport system permease component
LSAQLDTAKIRSTSYLAGQSRVSKPWAVKLFAISSIFLGWWVASEFIAGSDIRNPDNVLPSPLTVLLSWEDVGSFSISKDPAILVLVSHIFQSLVRLLGGLLIGTAVGLIVGLVICSGNATRAFLEPTVLAIRTIPIFALIPLFLTWFGGAEVGIYAFISFAVFSMVTVNTLEAYRNVPAVLKDYASTLGAKKSRIMYSVIVPSMVPELVGAGRVVIGLSWSLLLAGEFLAAQTGIGYMLIQARQFSNLGLMLFLVVVLALATWSMDLSFRIVAKKVTAWAPAELDAKA